MANAKSLLGVLTLAAAKGARVRIEASGEDAEQAVEALLELAELQFNMDY
jgi:phosphocarrier protein